MLKSSVREALVTSVRWRAPCVSFHSSHASTVPKASSPRSAAARTPGYVVENPTHLRAAEIRVDHQPGFRLERRRVALRAELVAHLGGPAVLPDDGGVDGLPRPAVPHHGGLALVGDADGRDVAGRDVQAGDGLAGHADLRRPDLVRVVLDPARLRKNLPELPLRNREHAALPVEDDGAGAGRTLIEGEDVFGHGGSRGGPANISADAGSGFQRAVVPGTGRRFPGRKPP